MMTDVKLWVSCPFNELMFMSYYSLKTTCELWHNINLTLICNKKVSAANVKYVEQ